VNADTQRRDDDAGVLIEDESIAELARSQPPPAMVKAAGCLTTGCACLARGPGGAAAGWNPRGAGTAGRLLWWWLAQRPGV